MLDLVIRNSRLFTPEGIISGGLGIKSGIISIISNDSNLPKADRVIDAKERLVIPGLFDTHVHFRSPESDIEGFESGSRAAASTGITTVFDMPGSNPGVISRSALSNKVKHLSNSSIVDYGLYAGIGENNLNSVSELSESGAIAFKTFMTPSASYSVNSDHSLYDLLTRVSKTNLRACFHAENPDLINFFTDNLQSQDRSDPMAHPESRPNIVEYESISKILHLSKSTQTNVHIVHMSTKEGVLLFEAAKKNDQNVSVETCPQYLVLDQDLMRTHGPHAKINPPLRTPDDQAALWRGLQNGTIDIITSDHAPHPGSSKDLGWDDIWASPPGSPGVEATTPIMLTAVNNGKISIERLISVMSTAPAKIFNLFPKKGVLQIGSDADIVILDMKSEYKLQSENLHTKVKDGFLYDGWKVKGKPIFTIVRGNIVMEDGDVIGKPGWGEFLKPLSSTSR